MVRFYLDLLARRGDCLDSVGASPVELFRRLPWPSDTLARRLLDSSASLAFSLLLGALVTGLSCVDGAVAVVACPSALTVDVASGLGEFAPDEVACFLSRFGLIIGMIFDGLRGSAANRPAGAVSFCAADSGAAVDGSGVNCGAGATDVLGICSGLRSDGFGGDAALASGGGVTSPSVTPLPPRLLLCAASE